MLTIDDRFIEGTRGKLFARRWQPSAPRETPIVLVHDSLGCVEMWRDFPEQLALATGCTVIAYDRAGHGKSDTRSDRPTFDFIREEAEKDFPRVAKAFGLNSYFLFGHSVGGGIALSIAAAFPDACRAVVSESAQAFVEELTLEGVRETESAFRDPERLQKLARFHGEKTAWVLEAWTKTWSAPEFRDWSLDLTLARVQCPVLALHGDEDEYGSTEFAERIASHVQGPSKAYILEGFGHVPHREDPVRILQLTSTFFTGS